MNEVNEKNENTTTESRPSLKDEKSGPDPKHSPMVQEFIDSLVESNRKEAKEIAAWKGERRIDGREILGVRG